MRRIGLVVAWSAATLVAMTIAATAVGSVRGHVTDLPAIPTAGTAMLLTTTTTSDLTESSTTSTPPTTDSAAPSTTTTTTRTTTTTTVPPGPATTTSTTVPPGPATTTTVPPGPAITTYTLIGGQVTISALEPEVGLVAAVPSAGFSAEIEESGPEEVEIDFKSSDHKSSFQARWKDGELDVKIDEELDDD